jgi:multimeric flavodoxin WrbA
MSDKIKILGICGSPRKGNSHFLLERALAAAWESLPDRLEVNRFHLARRPIAPCDACMAHRQREGECRIEDAFQELRDLWVGADVVLYAFPVYHMSIPAQLKAFIDRLGNSLGYYFQRSEPRTYHIPRLLKAMGFLTQGAHLYGGQDLALNFMVNHALLMRCVPVAGDLPDSYVGAGGWTGGQPSKQGLEELYERGDRDAVISVEGSQQVARRAVQTAIILQEGLQANRQALAHDPDYGFVLEKLSG